MALGKNMKIDRLIPVAKVKKSTSDEKSKEDQVELNKEVVNDEEVETKVSVSLDDFFDSLTTEPIVQEIIIEQPIEKQEVKPTEVTDSNELDVDRDNFKMIFKPSRRKTQKRILIHLEGELTIKNAEIINNNIKKVFEDFDNVELILNNITEIDVTFIQMYHSIKSFYLPLNKILSMNAEWSKEDKKILATCGFSDVLSVN
ncbi:MAG: hypothetical protein ACK48V_05090 [Crocinitomicaceae bacterium]|jgi:hypothetical protein